MRVWRLGYATRFIALTLLQLGHQSSAASRLIIRELYFTGVLSLIIILVSGLFVGMVLGLQGYQTLQDATARESALGVLVALSLVRELGPVVAALLFASRAGSAMTAEIGLMKATEQLVGDGNDGGRSDRARGGAALLGGVISMPLLAAMFSAMGVFGGYLIGVVMIGVDEGSFWSQMQSARRFPRGHRERRDQERRVRRGGDLDRVVRRLRCAADGGRRFGRDHAHRGDFVAGGTGAGFRADRIHVSGV